MSAKEVRYLRQHPRLVPLAALTLLLVLCAVMLYRAPVHRYVIACERTAQVECVLEQASSAETRRSRVPLGSDASAVVRIVSQRRGGPRVFLYLASPAHALFAAEFEGADAAPAAEGAAAKLNQVLRATSPAAARVEAVPPPLFRWLAWAGLAVMGLVIGAAYKLTNGH